MTNLIGHSIGRYHILEKLGEGGMAVVYKAYDMHLERDVAIKLIRRNAFSPDVLDRVLKRFDREAKSLAKLTHPNIVSIIDYGEFEDSPYLVMPYLQGGTLKQYLGKPMVWLKAIELLIPIGDALGYAHLKGIIHRDVKPGNILITEGGLPMLTDFGIARLLENEDTQTLTGTGVGVGTPEYMSPEQGLGREVDGRTDIYSLGVVLYELVTGRKPYTADTPMAVVLKQSTEPLPRPTDFVKDLPESIEKLLIKALAKNPDDRYQDMAGFTAALEGLEREEVSAALVTASTGVDLRTVGDTYATFDWFSEEETENEVHKVSAIPLAVEQQTQPKQEERTASVGSHTGRNLVIVGSIALVAELVIGAISGWFTPHRAAPSPTNELVIAKIETPSKTTEPPRATERKITNTVAPTLINTIKNELLPAQEVFPGETKAIRWLGSIGVIGDFNEPSDLFIQCLTCDEEVEQQVTLSGDFFFPSWSPDGTMIAAIKLDINTWERKLFIMDANGSWEKELNANNPQLNYVNWSPDGENIAYGSEEGELWIINVLTNENYMVLSKDTIETNFQLDDISWSPDGKTLLFLTPTGGDDFQECGTIWIVKPDGSDLVRFDSPSGYCILSAAWSVKQDVAFSWIPITDGEYGEEESLILNVDSLFYEKLEEAIIIESDLYYPQYIYCGPGYGACYVEGN